MRPQAIPCPNPKTSAAPAAITSFCRPYNRKASTARPLATAPPIPMRSVGSSRGSAASPSRSSCPSRIWSRLGAEQDAYMSVDATGTPFAGGGLNTGLRDLARFGEMVRNKGFFNGQQIIPAAAIADIRQGGKPADFAKAGYTLLPGWSYRNMWWITHNDHGAFAARGVHGQALYIDPKAEMVIARYGSHPVAGNVANDPTTLPAFEALARYLMKKPR